MAGAGDEDRRVPGDVSHIVGLRAGPGWRQDGE